MASASDTTSFLTIPDADVTWISPRPKLPLAIVDYNPAWPSLYQAIESLIRASLSSETILHIQHVGSTSVPGLPAKDIIDIDLVVADPSREETYVQALENAGFRFILREPKWYEHRLFHLDGAPHHANLHVFGPSSPEVVRHRLFRDWLREHPEDCARYVDAKRGAAEQTVAEGGNMQQYTDRKDPVVRDILNRIFKAEGLLPDE
ncbi:GrpB domain protein [Xylariaceae sp. FL0594]|nr:GrpB domain protein [Xylariaceae sp. FL0594]